ncbi:MAG TPA: glycosyltransferase [Flavisolibacter sp.]|jgi:glycosyltransferase involved in cell wall biosynthesis|nr:glycosyltransferase [Flavisolibacter sp.]
MKLLIVTHLIPYPLSDGGRISQYALLDFIRHKCSVTLVVFTRSQTEIEHIQELQKKWPNVRVEAVSLQVPLPLREKRSIGRLFRSAFELILHKANKVYGAIYKPAESSPPDDEKLFPLVDFIQPKGRKVIDELLTIVAGVKPDIVQLEFVELLDLFCCLPKQLPKVFVHHELRFVRVQTEYKTFAQGSDNYGHYLEQFTWQCEINLLGFADGIITLSEEDKDLLTCYLPKQQITSSPFPVLDGEFRSVSREQQRVVKLVFVGGEFHSPNKDAVQWYMESMAESIFTRFGLVLHVIGKWSKETIGLYHNNPAVKFAGYIEDVGAYCQNSIMLVPLRIGSGIRYKILYAAAWGLPVVSTTLGCQGIVENEKICLIANTPAEFMDALSTLVQSEETCLTRAAGAQASVRQQYSQAVAGERRLSFYRELLENLALVKVQDVCESVSN